MPQRSRLRALPAAANWATVPPAACCSPTHACPYPALALRLQVVGIVGATCGTTMGFIFPGMLALRDPQGGTAYKAFGWLLLAAGALLFGIGVTSS